jgi:hypothetical protein
MAPKEEVGEVKKTKLYARVARAAAPGAAATSRSMLSVCVDRVLVGLRAACGGGACGKRLL